MSIAKQITVRHKAEGHVRFVVPRELVHPFVASQLEQGLRQVEGVYRVDLYPRQGKLSIRYLEGVTDLKAVARALFEIVGGLEFPPAEPSCCSANPLAHQEASPGVGGWLKAKFQGAKQSLTQHGILAPTPGNTLSLTPEKEKFMMEFATDILVLYLIKTHWHMILTEWMKRPWAYRYEWSATFYLIFLLVRSKIPK